MSWHFGKIADMDLIGRLPAPSDLSDRRLERSQKKHGLRVRAGAEIDPDIGSTRIGIEFAWKEALARGSEIATSIDEAGRRDQPISLDPDNDGQGAMLARPPNPEVRVPIEVESPLTVLFDHLAKPGKMRDKRLSRVKEVFHYGQQRR